MPAPATVTPLFCSDEAIAIRAGDDYTSLCPSSNVLASGTDGVIAAGSPWTLTSATVDFQSNGVAAPQLDGTTTGHVVHLSGGTPKVPGTGPLFAVDSASAGALVLRRLGYAAGIGQPPTPATGLTFKVLTFTPQIEEATFDLAKRYGVDPLVPGRTSADLTDLRDLRRLCVLEVLWDRYTAANRSKDGDFAAKIDQLAGELAVLRERVALRWGPLGMGDEPTTSGFGGRVIR